MKWAKYVKVRLVVPLILLVFALVLVLDMFVIERPAMAQVVKANADEELIAEMNRIQGTLNRLFRTGNKEGIQQEISFLTQRLSTDLVLLLDENSRPIAASRYALLTNFPKDELSPQEWKLAKEAIAQMRVVTYIDNTHPTITGFFPIQIDIGNYDIRTQQIGLFIIRKNYAITLNQIEASSLQRLAVFIAILVLLGILLWFFFETVLTRPLQHILSASKKIANGDYTTKIKIEGFNELDNVSQAFNTMVREIAKREEQLRNLMQNVKTGIVVHAADTTITDSNHEAERILGLNADQMRGKTAIDPEWHFVDEAGAALPLDAYPINRALREKEEIKDYLIGVNRPDRDAMTWVLVNAVTELEENGEVSRVLVAFTDITESKNHQTELEQQVAREVEKQRYQEQQLLQQARVVQMGEMITNISHHWRQPLNLIGLNIQDLLDAYNFGELTEGYLEKTVKESMETIYSMSTMIDTFRDLTVGTQSKEAINVEKIVNEVVGLVKPGLESHFIDVQTELQKGLYTFGSSRFLAQALFNIITNAEEALLERNIADKQIMITLQKSEAGKPRIIVGDNAGGIDEAVMERIFDPFFTTKELATKTGTGLYFAKIFIERELGGRVTVRNRNDGAEFTIDLPGENTTQQGGPDGQ